MFSHTSARSGVSSKNDSKRVLDDLKWLLQRSCIYSNPRLSLAKPNKRLFLKKEKQATIFNQKDARSCHVFAV